MFISRSFQGFPWQFITLRIFKHSKMSKNISHVRHSFKMKNWFLSTNVLQKAQFKWNEIEVILCFFLFFFLRTRTFFNRMTTTWTVRIGSSSEKILDFRLRISQMKQTSKTKLKVLSYSSKKVNRSFIIKVMQTIEPSSKAAQSKHNVHQSLLMCKLSRKKKRKVKHSILLSIYHAKQFTCSFAF